MELLDDEKRARSPRHQEGISPLIPLDEGGTLIRWANPGGASLHDNAVIQTGTTRLS